MYIFMPTSVERVRKQVIQSNGSYHLHVSGSMNALIKALSHHEVNHLLVEEAPLEEVFLKFYEVPHIRATVTR